MPRRKKQQSGSDFPRTIEAAVALVISRMSPTMRSWMTKFKGDELAFKCELSKNMVSGMSVRAMLGLWGENQELLAKFPRMQQHPDDASAYILLECWRKLRSEAGAADTHKKS